jgi:hypothetical protein
MAACVSANNNVKGRNTDKEIADTVSMIVRAENVKSVLAT